MDYLRNLLALVRGFLWLIPSLLAVAAAGLAYFLLAYGEQVAPQDGGAKWWLYSGDANTARDLLASLLSGLMTITSLVVSVTFVILTIAANQLGPRLIGIFMADRQIQAVLGLFIGTILYVVLILRRIDDTLGPTGVPHMAVTVGTLLTVLCVLALLFYIHKIARLIIADTVVEKVARELQRRLCEVMPGSDEDQQNSEERVREFPAWAITSGKAGYIQVIDYTRLVALAQERDVTLEVPARAGQYILRRGVCAAMRGPIPPDEATKKDLRKAFTVGPERTPAQDPEHGIRQLVEIATRALSPGINDLFTAIAVIDRLGSAFEKILDGELQPRVLCDRDGTVRVRADRSDIDSMLRAAFYPIRQAGEHHPAILLKLADTLGALAPSVRGHGQRIPLANQLTRVAESLTIQNFSKGDRDDISGSIETARLAIAAAGA